MVKPADKGKVRVKQDADYIFHELTRSICPECKTVIDAQIIIKETKVLMRKRCPTAGSSPSAPTIQWGTGRRSATNWPRSRSWTTRKRR
ncbi:MAG: hypothetical protein FI723_05680 [SAR202 cluster bacterium]|nr:hypothetical protein [SAR202 cluster bacterium]